MFYYVGQQHSDAIHTYDNYIYTKTGLCFCSAHLFIIELTYLVTKYPFDYCKISQVSISGERCINPISLSKLCTQFTVLENFTYNLDKALSLTFHHGCETRHLCKSTCWKFSHQPIAFLCSAKREDPFRASEPGGFNAYLMHYGQQKRI